MARELKRVNMNIPEDVLARVDEYADRMSINRTAAFIVLVNMALDNQRAMQDLNDFVQIAKLEQLRQKNDETSPLV